MSNPLWTQIKIFGNVPEKLLEELYSLLKDEFTFNECFNKKEPKQSLRDWFKKNVNDKNILEFSDGEANYGVFDALETFLEKNNISYIRESAGDGGECVPEVIYFNGNTKVQLETNSDNNPILPVQKVVDICNISMEMEKEFKKGNAPLYATEEFDTIQSIMAKYALSKPYTPTGAELIKAYIESQYPAIPNKLPPFKVVKE